MKTFKKYKTNLKLVNFEGETYIQSYSTLVAKIQYDTKQALVLGYWSVTTSKHINYACKELGLIKVNKY